MISVANFYWLLYQKLLEPVGLNGIYFSPWGTKDNFHQYQFKKFVYQRDVHHVLFYFDQEPIWSEELGVYDTDERYWSRKYASILANSEHSLQKNQLCKSRPFLDWYFFYHGFAALDWFRDSQYIDVDHSVTKPFISLNHMFDKRAYRLALLARLLNNNISLKDCVSFHVNRNDLQNELENSHSDLSSYSKSIITKQFCKFVDLPWKVDNVEINAAFSASFGYDEYKLWQSALLHVVNETVFYEPKLHLTEKIFKPIVALRPFVLVAAPGNLQYLRSYGFKTFGSWIDESYDDIQDHDTRLDALSKEISRFAQMPMSQLNAIHKEMMPTLAFNRKHFFNNFRIQIVNELVDNFERCIIQWNNGRVNGKQLICHPDFDGVKKFLSQ